jgi:collagen triple helix repeat protein
MNGFSGLCAGRMAARVARCKRIVIASTMLTLALLTIGVGSASAESRIALCVPKGEGANVLTPRHGACKKGYKLTHLNAEGKEGKAGAEGRPGTEGKAGAEGKVGAEGKAGAEGKPGSDGKPGPEGKSGFTPAQTEQLKSLLPYVSFLAAGVGGKPTIQFSGVNVQIVNGEGKTATVNGEGNLVIGYDENTGKHEQTGSNNLILGEEQTFTSYAGIDAGFSDTISAPFATVTGGGFNKATFKEATVSGGWANTASKENASVSGGRENKATNEYASVSGGALNTASGKFASIFGGKGLTANVEYEAIP